KLASMVIKASAKPSESAFACSMSLKNTKGRTATDVNAAGLTSSGFGDRGSAGRPASASNTASAPEYLSAGVLCSSLRATTASSAATGVVGVNLRGLIVKDRLHRIEGRAPAPRIPPVQYIV